MVEPEPNEETLADGFVESTSNPKPKRRKRSPEDKDPEQDLFLKWVREVAQSEIERLNKNYEVVKCQIDDGFREFIVKSYLCPIQQMVNSGRTWAELGRRFDNDQATVHRWYDGELDIKISNLAVIYAAENARFRNGHQIAVDAYVYAFAIVCEELEWNASVDCSTVLDQICPELSVGDIDDDAFRVDFFNSDFREEVVILYHVMRTPEWWKARKSRRASDLREAVELILKKTIAVIPCEKQWGVDEIVATVEKHSAGWSMMEAVLHYEWF